MGGPVANLALAALGGVAMAAPAVAGIASSRWSFVVLNLLLAGFNLLPGLPLDGGQLVESLVWGVSGRRDLGLVVAGWCGRLLAVGVVLWFVALPLARGDPGRPRRSSSPLVMAWILWSGATAAIRRAPWSGSSLRVRPEDVIDPVAVVPALTPVGELVHLGRRVVALDERGLPTLLLPEPSESTPDIATLAADDAAGLARRQAPR